MKRSYTDLVIALCGASMILAGILIAAAIGDAIDQHEYAAIGDAIDQHEYAALQEPMPPKRAKYGPTKGMVSTWYGDFYHGRITASGAHKKGPPEHWTFNSEALTAAHKTLPFGTRLQVAYRGRQVEVVISDRGPYGENRDLDLSAAAFRELAPLERGVIRVQVREVLP